jgi:hypothetical protein
MAINQFKEIVDKKGYKVDSKDRAIFEKEVAKSYFGMGDADTIEFVLYDSSDNILPQGENGELARYIFLNDVNISKYFIFTENSSNKRLNGAKEYIIDTEFLVREAGYSTGIFKTQTTLLNRRVGSETVVDDKLWIHEISPSRTEIRVLPINGVDGKPNSDLTERLNILLSDGHFKDDTIYFIQPYIESLKVENILKSFVTSKGTVVEGENYIKLIQTEFGINDWENFIKIIRDKLVESTLYWIQNRDSNINSINYGNPLSTPKPIELSITQIKNFVKSSLIEIIKFYLPTQNIQEDNILTPAEQITFDATKDILKTILSNNVNSTTDIGNRQSVVRGCTDREATNYNPLAVEDDGSCQYLPIVDATPISKIKGCTDINALNYNKFATEDDGSCTYAGKPQTTTKTFYVWSSNGSVIYTDTNGVKSVKVVGSEYDSLTISYQTIESFEGDVREVPKIKETLPIYSYNIYNGSGKYYGYNGYGYSSNQYGNHNYGGWDYINNTNYGGGFANSIQYRDASGAYVSTPIILPGETVTVCAVENSIVHDRSEWVVRKMGNCDGSVGEII